MPNLEEALQQAKDKQGKPKFSRGNRPDRAVRSEPDNPNGSTFNRPLTPLAAVAIPAHFELAQNDPAENRRDAGSYAEKYSAKTNIAQEELAHNKPTKPEPVISSVETVIEPKTTFAKAPPLMEGYFKFSHGVFQNPILRDLSGDSFRIFLFLSSRAWQFPDSTGEVRASYSFIEMNTGVSVAQIKRSLSQMRDLGLARSCQ